MSTLEVIKIRFWGLW